MMPSNESGIGFAGGFRDKSILHFHMNEHVMCRVLSAALLMPAIVLLVSSSRSLPPNRSGHAAALVARRVCSGAGRPLIHDFSPAEYGAGSVMRRFTQDRQGMIYVGNDDDGVLALTDEMASHCHPNLSAVRALATDSTGRVYVGAVGELGYLAPDESGQMHYVSLLDRIPLRTAVSRCLECVPDRRRRLFRTFVGIFDCAETM